MRRIGVFLLAIALALRATAQEAEAPRVARHPSTTQDQPEPVPVLNLADVQREALDRNPAIQSCGSSELKTPVSHGVLIPASRTLSRVWGWRAGERYP